MIIVFVAKDFSRFATLVARLRLELEVQLIPVVSGSAGLIQLKGREADLIVVDEQLDDMSGIDFIKQLVLINPSANTALVGSLTEEAFHEATEGLGVLTQLPPRPDEKDAAALLAVVAKITQLMQQPSKTIF